MDVALSALVTAIQIFQRSGSMRLLMSIYQVFPFLGSALLKVCALHCSVRPCASVVAAASGINKFWKIRAQHLHGCRKIVAFHGEGADEFLFSFATAPHTASAP